MKTLLTIPANLARAHGGKDAMVIAAKMVETFELHGGLTSHSTVLDIGCGPGRMALAIGQRYGFGNPRYLGFDINKTDIAWCAEITKLYPNFSFLHLDAENLHYNKGGRLKPWDVRFPAESGAFDFVFATSVFTHMRTRETVHYFTEAKRCLAPGGRFFATFFCLEQIKSTRPPRFNFTTKVDERCYTARPDDPEDVIGYMKDFVLATLHQLGFSTTFYRGEWIGGDRGRHSQDYVVAMQSHVSP